MSIRLDPRRLGVLKRLAAEAGVRPGDLVRVWTEERIDADRGIAAGPSLVEQVAALAARLDALEAAANRAPVVAVPAREPESDHRDEVVPAESRAERAAPKPRAKSKASASAKHTVALHEEMIAVLTDAGPMSAADLAAAVVERDRYHPPRSGKPIDAAMISQRVSNPTYRARFTRNEGLIGLAS
ncbi:MAG TPA: hypothetical protein VIH24_09180 [Candidatus Limnocylindria bacterium]